MAYGGRLSDQMGIDPNFVAQVAARRVGQVLQVVFVEIDGRKREYGRHHQSSGYLARADVNLSFSVYPGNIAATVSLNNCFTCSKSSNRRCRSVGKCFEILAFFEDCSLRLPTASVKSPLGNRSLCRTTQSVNKTGPELRPQA